MKTIILIIAVLISLKVIGQNQEVENLVNEGITLHDQGDYNQAISKYQQALTIDPKSPFANYEIAFTYYHVGDYKKAIEHCNTVLESGENHLEAYIVQGSCYDELGKSKKSIKVYNKGLKEYPGNYLLHFNKAISYFGMRKYDKSEEEALAAIANNIVHPSSHLLLGNIFELNNKRVKALMSYYFFLLLEPDSKRSPRALNSINDLLYKGIEQTTETNLNINIEPSSIKDNEFGTADIMLSVKAATRYMGGNDTISDEDFFVKINEDFFTLLDELQNESKQDNFYWNFYVSFYADLNASGYTEPFCYYIMQSSDSPNIEEWMLSNSDKIQGMFKWLKNE